MGEYVDLDERLRRIAHGELDRFFGESNGSVPHTELSDFAVDWATAWDTDVNASDWLLEPLIARGRGHALYAPAKTGKSLIALEAAAALATGRPFLHWAGGTRHHVGYLDYEMTLADLIERLIGFGYGPEDDLSHLHYILLPTIPTLDTGEGAEIVVQAVTAWGCEWVVIDTMGRAVSGVENDSTAYMAFARVTGIALKSAGIAYHRLDHAGKNMEQGQRGSSAKNDDVDVVQRLTKLDDGGMRLEATHRRMSWVPERVDLAQVEDELAGTMSHLVSQAILASEGVSRLIDALDRLEVPLDASRRQARVALKNAGEKCRDVTLAEALKQRKMSGNHASEEMIREVLGTGSGTKGETPVPQRWEPAGTREAGVMVPTTHTPKVCVVEPPWAPVPDDPPRRDLY